MIRFAAGGSDVFFLRFLKLNMRGLNFLPKKVCILVILYIHDGRDL